MFYLFFVFFFFPSLSLRALVMSFLTVLRSKNKPKH